MRQDLIGYPSLNMLLILNINDDGELSINFDPNKLNQNIDDFALVLHNLLSGYYADKILASFDENTRSYLVDYLNMIDDQLDLKDAKIPIWRNMNHE